MHSKKIFMLFFFNSFLSLLAFDNKTPAKSITIFGSLFIEEGIQEFLSTNVFYKGGLYRMTVQSDPDVKKADFELYDETKPNQLHIIISDNFKKPEENTVEHWETLPGHPYRYFRLTRYSLVETSPLNQKMNVSKRSLMDYKDSWDIEELDNTKTSIIIPDNALIIFLPAEIIDHLEPISWLSNNTSVKLPQIILKNKEISELKDILAQVSAVLPNFRGWHLEPFKVYYPHSKNHLLSMPFNPRSGNC